MKLDKEFIEQVTCDNYKCIFENLLKKGSHLRGSPLNQKLNIRY